MDNKNPTAHSIIYFATLPILKKFTHRLSNKPFLIWLLTTPSHLKYVATLSCNFSLMVCFADSNISQGSEATVVQQHVQGAVRVLISV